MTKHPILNALAAEAYIVFIGLVFTFGEKYAPREDTLLAPMAVISLFTLSAAVMGYVFCWQPGQLYFDGKKKQAVNLFLQTVGAFGVITMLLFGLLFSGAFWGK